MSVFVVRCCNNFQMHIIGGKNSKNSIRRFFNLENGKTIPYGTYDALITKVMLMLVYLMITAGVCCQFNIFMVEHPGKGMLSKCKENLHHRRWVR